MMKTTKELAREMGLLRRRSKAEGPALRVCGGNRQTFQYLVVIDFESTCWKDQKFQTQEIIEFPAVLLNTSSGVCESEFHFYVQPCEEPMLSDFCKQLTGITQAQVEDGIPLSLCMKKFGHWIEKLNREKNVLFNPVTAHPVKGTFVTWSDWDLSVCLQYECKRKQIMKPAYLNSWIDLRATYRNFYGRKPNGLNGALQDLGIEFSGRQHSGVDDARNTARLAWRMMRDGCILNVTKTLKEMHRGDSEGVSESAKQQKPGANSSLQPPDDKQDTSAMHLFKRPLAHGTSPVTSSSLRSPLRKQPRVVQNSHKPLAKAVADSSTSTAVRCHCPSVGTGNPTVSSIKTKIFKSKICEGTVFRKPKSPVSSKPVYMISTNIRTVPNRPDSTVFTKPLRTVSTTVSSRSGNTAFTKPSNPLSSRSRNVFTKPVSTMSSTSGNTTFTKAATAVSSRSDKMTFIKPANTVSSRPRNAVFTSKPLVSSTNTNDSVCANRPTGLPQSTESRSGTDLKSRNIVSAKVMNTPGSETMCSKSGSEFDKENQLPTPKWPSPPNANSVSVEGNHTPSPLYRGHQRGMVTPVATRPHGGPNKPWSSASITPPLCLCGKRSKRRFVQSPGPNQGRCFYSCPIGRRQELHQNRKSPGCQFFKWESILSKGQVKFAPVPGRNAMSTGLLKRQTNKLQPDSCLTASCNTHLRKSSLIARPSLHMR